MNDSLEAMSVANRELRARLEAATSAMARRAGRSETTQRVDMFLIDTCRHLAAVCDVLLPAAKTELCDGNQRVRSYVDQCRRLERAIIQTKHRLYGEAHMVGVSWTEAWRTLCAEFARLDSLEHELVATLANLRTGSSHAQLPENIRAVALLMPTRAHPHSPHIGRVAHLGRKMWARVDRVWDGIEGRGTSASDSASRRPGAA